ncbi:hypothetical protein ACTHGU_01965 [Chitinophagaceae bacterium MMS25-I14]
MIYKIRSQQELTKAKWVTVVLLSIYVIIIAMMIWFSQPHSQLLETSSRPNMQLEPSAYNPS